MPENFEALLQLGFAAGTATWLIYWMTTTMSKAINANTKATLGLQLFVSELYRLLMQHDAHQRQINPGNEADSEELRSAQMTYTQVLDRLDQLRASVQNCIDEMRR